MLTYLLVVVGALNWGLIAFFGFNLVGAIFGAGTYLERVIYAVVGISAVVQLVTHYGECKTCQNALKMK
jgi:uncharacterized membrane protein YuzA (DUF378 family)